MGVLDSLAPTTKSAYRSGINAFFFFLFVLGSLAPAIDSIPSLPSVDRDALVCEFAAFLAMTASNRRAREGLGLSFATVSSYVSAVSKYFFLRSNSNWLADCHAWPIFKKSLRKSCGAANAATAMSAHLLAGVVKALSLVGLHQEAAAIVLAWFFLLRSGEYLCTPLYKDFDGAGRHLRVADLQFFDCNQCLIDPSLLALKRQDVAFMRLFVKTSKQDWMRVGAQLFCWRVSATCVVHPVVMLIDQVIRRQQQGATAQDPLFVHSSQPMTASYLLEAVRKQLVGMCLRSGVVVDPMSFTLHSLRSGGATALFEAGASALHIKKLGRWISDCYMAYSRRTPTSMRHFSSLMASV